MEEKTETEVLDTDIVGDLDNSQNETEVEEVNHELTPGDTSGLVAGLQAMAQLLANHPEYAEYARYTLAYNLICYPHSDALRHPANLAALARDARRAGFKVRKEYRGTSFVLEFYIPMNESTESYLDQFRFGVTVSRDLVCTPKVVGSEVKKTRKMVVEPVFADVEEDTPIVEWDCHPLLSSEIDN